MKELSVTLEETNDPAETITESEPDGEAAPAPEAPSDAPAEDDGDDDGNE